MLHELDPLLHSQLRLGIISLLVNVEFAEFIYLKEQTNATAGNLSVQIEKLKEAGYIIVEKTYKGKRPVTYCSITKQGIRAFEQYVKDIQQYINNKK